MSTSNDDALQNTENIKEQQRIHRNMLRRTRYAQMSPETKHLLLSQQQAKRAESKRQRLLQHSNNMISSSQVDSQEGDQNMLTICHPSLATDEGDTSVPLDTSGYITTFEIGSTSRRYDEAKMMSSPLLTSNTCTSLSAKVILDLSSAHNGIIIYHVQPSANLLCFPCDNWEMLIGRKRTDTQNLFHRSNTNIDTMEHNTASIDYTEVKRQANDELKGMHLKIQLYRSCCKFFNLSLLTYYVGPDATPMPGVPPSGPAGIPGQLHSPVNVCLVAGHGRDPILGTSTAEITEWQ
ncbi:hypothetical protein KY284_007223 [Solanum tuberosum]|nr:hypothetical protein KY284_007223 [Solanum tuberosum]